VKRQSRRPLKSHGAGVGVMTNFPGEPVSSQTANAACGGPQGGGMDSRRTSTVADASAGYFAHSASASLNSVQGGVVCPPGYKKTEVGVIPEDWELQPLGQHA